METRPSFCKSRDPAIAWVRLIAYTALLHVALYVAVTVAVAAPTPPRPAETSRAKAARESALLDRWLEQQATVTTWSASLIQTRTYKTLTQPLVSPGHVWFRSPGQFRWQLENPPTTIAVRDKDRLTVLHPRLDRSEVHDLTDVTAAPWKEALVLFEAGFPKSRQDMDSRFTIVSQETTGTSHHITLRPRSSAARRWLRSLVLEIDTGELVLRATRLDFADGSTLRNDFTDPVVNAPQDDALYQPTLSSPSTDVRPSISAPAVAP